MKIVKYSVCAFLLSLILVSAGVNADVYRGFMDFTIKNFSQATKIYSTHKNEDCYQWLEKNDALDDISHGGRAMQGRIDSNGWIDLPNHKPQKYNYDITYFGDVDYTHYVKAKKSTLSTVSYWGFWCWDMINGPGY